MGCLNVIFWWFVGIYWGKMLVKYQNTYILTIWSQNVTFYRFTLVMNCKKSLFFFTFPIVPCTMCCLKVIFWWFGRIYWGEILIKNQNTYILTILAPKCDRLQPYPGHESQKNHYFFHFCITIVYTVMHKGNFFIVW